MPLADTGQHAPCRSSPPGPRRGDVRGVEVLQEALGWLEVLQGEEGLGDASGGAQALLGLLTQRAVFPVALFYYSLLAGCCKTT